MATRSGKVSSGDIASITIALASLVVSVVALKVSQDANELAFKAWVRPAPADPTYIPSFGQSDNPETIDAGEGGRRFFEFLDKYQDRKIRIVASVAHDQVTIQENGSGESNYFYMHRKCPTGQECFTEIDSLYIEGTGPDKPGLRHGRTQKETEWFLSGYFANSGLVVEKQNTSERTITAIDIVTAVS